jgi:four helix bundle protein
MGGLIPAGGLLSRPEPDSDRRLRAFRATDAFALEAFQAVRALGKSEGEMLAREIRRVAARSGGSLVAASAAPPGGDAQRRGLEVARSGLLEVRYYLYLARRLGFLDIKRYRSLVTQQDAALREVEALLEPAPDPTAPRGV